MTFGEFQPEDLSFTLVELEFVLGFLSGLGLVGVRGAWPPNSRPDSTGSGGVGVDVVGMDVSVEAMEEESWDLEEREEEGERDCESCV